MSSPIKPTMAQIETVRQAIEANKINLKELDKLIAAGANLDEVNALKEEYKQEIARAEQFLKVYG